jgi:uroporphyrinogen-III decarboxylase
MIDKGIRILRLGDSAANMTVISPSMWREFIKPQFTRICKEVHDYCGEAKIYCHICGNVLPIIPDLVETNIDCIAPLDPLGNFTISEVRKIVGPHFMLMGGVNTLSFINKTEDEIIKEAEQCIRDGFTNNGHFAVGSGCVVPRSAKAEVIRGLARASKNMKVS